MLFGGIDIGSRAAKVVVMQDDEIFASTIQDTGPESVKTAHMAMNAALDGTGVKIEDLDYVLAILSVLAALYWSRTLNQIGGLHLPEISP